ncbi:UNVERIFIED_CONTAM: hypothetical protein Sangu_0175000 [Sesamum angustifolium]|uniref:Uncharacterized protein n=1 Tax=Sesamum angustifolium TaxID=2727405 RepID=A0AAW2RLM9_9LAMI
MVYDATGLYFFSAHPNPEPVGACSSIPTDSTKVSPNSYGYAVSRLSDRFYDVVHVADHPLYNSCNESQLSTVARLVNIKAENNMSERCYDQASQWASDLLPRDHTLPLLQHKEVNTGFGFACREDSCMLYASPATAEHMTWHACHQTDKGSTCHPSDAEAWRHFD